MSKNQVIDDIEVIFGSISSLICRDLRISQRLNASTTAMLRFDKSDFLELGAVNYLDVVVINSVSQKRLLYTGYIVSIKNEPNNQIVIHLDNGVELHETGIKALTVMRVDPREVAYSMARLAGFPQDHIDIPGLDNSRKEMVAFVPFKGLLIKQDENVSGVQLIALQSIKSIVEKFPKNERSEVWDGFLDADGWISFRFTASHFAEAEDIAIEKADVFLSAYSGLLQYSYSQFRGDFIEWERRDEASNLKRQNYMLLVMTHTGSAWLRDLFQLPLLVWNRFRDSEDYYVVTIGLWQVVELLSSGVKLSNSRTQEQLADLSSRAVANLTEEESNLVRASIKRLNDGALIERFKQHRKNIGIVLSKHEHELLDKFRKIRNAIEHGKKPEEPSVQEIKRVKALVNRVILASLTASDN